MPSYLDLGVLGVVFVSALLSMLRGFTREVLAIGSWAAAAAAAYYFYPMVLPHLTPFISKPIFAQAAAAASVFFVTLIVVSLFTVRVSDAILDSKIGALDRSLGFVFGAVRGFPARGRRVLDLQLAGRRQAAAGLGAHRQDPARADRDRPTASSRCCRKTRPRRSKAGSSRRPAGRQRNPAGRRHDVAADDFADANATPAATPRACKSGAGSAATSRSSTRSSSSLPA